MKLHEALLRFFESSAKREGSLIGVERETFILHVGSGRAASYDEPGGVREVVQKLMVLYPGAKPYQGEDLLGFGTDRFAVTLEPAAQLEISTSPSDSIRELGEILQDFSEKLTSVLTPMGLTACNCGCQPESPVDTIPLIPKERYRLMDRHFLSFGHGGREMMRGSCSTQVSLDYTSEEDFRLKVQAAHYWLPVLMLLMDLGSRFQGEPVSGFLKRNDIWERTDPDRCGILPGVFSPSYGFTDYVQFLERMPLILRETRSGAEYTGFQTVQEIYQDKEVGEKEILHILSMAFPYVRLKQYLEIRPADSVPIKYALAYCALLKGLLYSPEALALVQERIATEGVTEKQVQDTMQGLMRAGWAGTIYGRPADTFIRDALQLAGQSLNEEERSYLHAFSEVVDCKGIENVEK